MVCEYFYILAHTITIYILAHIEIQKSLRVQKFEPIAHSVERTNKNFPEIDDVLTLQKTFQIRLFALSCQKLFPQSIPVERFLYGIWLSSGYFFNKDLFPIFEAFSGKAILSRESEDCEKCIQFKDLKLPNGLKICQKLLEKGQLDTAEALCIPLINGIVNARSTYSWNALTLDNNALICFHRNQCNDQNIFWKKCYVKPSIAKTSHDKKGYAPLSEAQYV